MDSWGDGLRADYLCVSRHGVHLDSSIESTSVSRIRKTAFVVKVSISRRVASTGHV